jgi:hypothetical protein
MSAKTEDVEAAKARITKYLSELAKMRGIDKDLLASHAAQAKRIASLEEAGQAVVDRWDSPKWKDAEHTGVLIGRLRGLLTDNQGKEG